MKHHQIQVHVSYCRTKDKSRIRKTKNLSTDADITTDTKKILLVRLNLQQQQKNFFLPGNVTPFMSKGCPIWHPFFPLLFPKDSKNLKSLDIGLWASGGKNTFIWNKQVKKLVKNFFCHGNFTPFMSKSFEIWDHFFPLLFPKDSKNLKKFEHWTLGSWGKKTVKQSGQSQTDIRTFRLIERIGQEGHFFEKNRTFRN